MATKKKTAEAQSSGVEVRSFTSTTGVERNKDGVPVRTPDAPAQSAGSEIGQSAGKTKETD